MRVGPEQFIYRDFAFIDAMILPVVGPRTVAIYDVLRRHIWRTSSRGSKRTREAFKAGKLATSIGREKLAALSGVSVRTIQRHLNKLRDLGWVKSQNGNGTGETVVYELGERREGESERFYADDDARTLWLGLEELAFEEGLERVTELSCEVRVAFVRAWFERDGGGDKSVTTLVTPASPGIMTPVAPTIENPSGEEIEKSEEYVRCAHEHTSGPGPKHWDQPAGQERSRRSREKMKEGEASSAEIALDNALDPGHGGEDRVVRAAKAEQEGAAKADKAVATKGAKKIIDGLKEGRTKQVRKGDQDAQRSANLKGGTRFTFAVMQASRDLWDLYEKLIKGLNPALPVVRWDAEGNKKARGQVFRLVDMYGGDATEQALRYVVGNWDAINARFFKRGPGSVPHMGLLFSMHESLFREAALWVEHREILEDWEAWQSEHEHDDEMPPSELQERYETAHAALAFLGLGS